MKTRLQFYNLNCLMLNRFEHKYSYPLSDCLSTYKSIEQDNILATGPIFTFQDYLKSQIHYNLLATLENRDVKSYITALKVISNRSSDISTASRVVGYFYIDLCKTLNYLLETPTESEEEARERFGNGILLQDFKISKVDNSRNIIETKKVNLDTVVSIVKKMLNYETDETTSRYESYLMDDSKSELCGNIIKYTSSAPKPVYNIIAQIFILLDAIYYDSNVKEIILYE